MICTAEDPFTFEQWLSRARWTATLSSGLEVIQDDGRPGVHPESAWLRLGAYCREHGLWVHRLQIAFRNENAVVLPQPADGYYFRKTAGGFLGCETYGFYLVGWLAGGVLTVRKYQVPEMLLVSEETRDPDDERQTGPSLIRRP